MCYLLNGNGARADGGRNIDDFGCKPSWSWTRDYPGTNSRYPSTTSKYPSTTARYTRGQSDCHHRLGNGCRGQKPQRKGTFQGPHVAREIEDTRKWIQQYQEEVVTATCRFDTKDQKSVMVAKNVAIILLIVVEIKKMNTASGMHNIASSANGKTPPISIPRLSMEMNIYPTSSDIIKCRKQRVFSKGSCRTMPTNLSMRRKQLTPWSGKKVSRLLRYLLNKWLLGQCGAI